MAHFVVRHTCDVITSNLTIFVCLFKNSNNLLLIYIFEKISWKNRYFIVYNLKRLSILNSFFSFFPSGFELYTENMADMGNLWEGKLRGCYRFWFHFFWLVVSCQCLLRAFWVYLRVLNINEYHQVCSRYCLKVNFNRK